MNDSKQSDPAESSALMRLFYGNAPLVSVGGSTGFGVGGLPWAAPKFQASLDGGAGPGSAMRISRAKLSLARPAA
jgi:hypothetical protein